MASNIKSVKYTVSIPPTTAMDLRVMSAVTGKHIKDILTGLVVDGVKRLKKSVGEA